MSELRVLAGRTQEDVSANTGFKRANISRLEKRAELERSAFRDDGESPDNTLKIIADVADKEVNLPSIAERSRNDVKI